ncbi:MAG: hypothetical protein AAFR25_11340, partial [Cyanobacteria bacterium J06629_19]
NIFFVPGGSSENTNELTLKATLNATVEVTCEFSFYTQNDGEDYSVGSCRSTVDSEIEIDILISLTGYLYDIDDTYFMRTGNAGGEMDITGVEVVEIREYGIEFGMIEPD